MFSMDIETSVLEGVHSVHWWQCEKIGPREGLFIERMWRRKQTTNIDSDLGALAKPGSQQ